MDEIPTGTLDDAQTNDIFDDSFNESAQWESCVVVEIFPDKRTCAILTEKNHFFTGVPWPGDGSQVPERGEQYLAAHTSGKPVIIDAEDKPQHSGDTTKYDVSIQEEIGEEDPAYQQKGFNLSHEDIPGDVIGGDWVKTGELGNLVGVLKGGTSILKASEMAQLIATQANHMLKLIGKNLSLMSGAGTLEFQNEDGKSTIVLRAGSDEETETHPTAEDFRVRCEIGDEGEMVDFRITDHKGRILYRQHVDSDGRVDNVSQQKVETVRGDKKEHVEGDRTESTGGRTKREYGGTTTDQHRGSYEQRVRGHARIKAAKNAVFQSLQDLVLSAQRHIDIKAGGNLPGLGTGSDAALDLTVTNGNIDIDLGNPAAGDISGGFNSNFNLQTYGGDINFESLSGTFSVQTFTPNSVQLGGPAPEAFSAVLFESFKSIITLFTTLYDSHTHTHQAHGGTPTNPPVPPASPAVSSLMPLAKSRFVTFGG